MSKVFIGEDIEVESDSFTLLAVFNFLQIFGLTQLYFTSARAHAASSGFFSLLFVVLTAWISPGVYRTPAWYSFMGSWMFFCLSYFVIVGQQVGAEPPFGVCLAQSAAIYAAPPLTSCVSLALLLQLYSTVSSVLRSAQSSRFRAIAVS
ncbi:hypothetical protein C8R43DRAFT_1120477 [Mycena crocata]|nr:hypothetical protein C8R43DRAFT_1120477 [Mycena crocata]